VTAPSIPIPQFAEGMLARPKDRPPQICNDRQGEKQHKIMQAAFGCQARERMLRPYNLRDHPLPRFLLTFNRTETMLLLIV
jgi:hypothetical protein